jgi:hypothetical protein
VGEQKLHGTKTRALKQLPSEEEEEISDGIQKEI